ncbi:MAG: DUF192 domain-containing protein [Patescibacteria group bacterium]
MPKIIFIILVFFIIFFIYRIFYSSKFQSLNIDIKGQSFNLEVAKSLTQITKGLSNRTSLCPNCGMIFVFPSPQILSFWMKDTLIPLDIIFLDSKSQIVNFVTAEPEPNVPDNKLILFQSKSPANFAIEIPAGTIQKLNLTPGDQINLYGL